MKKLISLIFLITFISIFCYSQDDKVFTQIPIWGGQVEGAVMSYSSPTIIYAWNSLNLWISKDAGENWQKTKFSEKYGCGPKYVGVHHSSPNIVLAWIDYQDPSGQPNRGLVRSDDYGEKNWEKITDIDANFVPVGNNPIAFSIINPDNVYLFGNFWSTSEGPMEEKTVLYKSTDAGKTWKELSPFNKYVPPKCICVTHDGTNEVIYLAVNDYSKTLPATLYRSTDSANSWQQVGEFSDITDIKASTNNCVAISIYFAGSSDSGIFVSTNAGVSFSTLTEYENDYYEGNKTYRYRIKPTLTISPDGTKVYFPADTFDPSHNSTPLGPRIFVSTFTPDVGWSNPVAISSGLLGGYAGLEAKGILIDPTNPNNMYIADNFDYAFFKSTDGGHIWEAKNQGLAGAIVNSGAKDVDGNLYVVTKSAIYKSTDTGNSWSKIYHGLVPIEGLKIAAHPTESNLLFVLSFGTTGRSFDSLLFYSDNGGLNWKSSTGTVVNKFSDYDWGFYSSGAPWLGVTDIVFDPQNPNILYYGVHKNYYGGSNKYKYLYRVKFSSNSKQVEEIKQMNFDSLSIHSIAVDIEDPSILYVGVGEYVYWDIVKDGLYKIKIDENGDVLSSTKLLDNVVPYKIVIDSNNPNIIYAACYEEKMPAGPKYVNGYGPLYVSYDRGANWKKIGRLGRLTQAETGISRVIDLKVINSILYVANRDHDTGITNLYYSLNNGVTFDKYQENIGEIKCLILGSLYAGTSTGLWKLNRQPQPLTYEVEQPKVYAYPNPFNPTRGYIVLKYFVPQNKNVTSLKVSIYNIAGELVIDFPEDTNLSGGYAYYYAWDGKNKDGKLCARGVYIAVFKSNLGVSKTKIVLVK